MGTSTSPDQLARKIERLAKGLNDVRIPLNATGLAGKRIFESAAASAGALGKRPAGKRKIVTAGYDLTNDGRAVVVTYKGPAHLINNPTRPHFIAASAFGSRSVLAGAGRGIGAVTAFGGTGRGMLTGLSQKGRRRARSGKRALTIGSNLRAYAFHPGTPGKGFYKVARSIAVKRLPAVYAKSGVTQPLKMVFS